MVMNITDIDDKIILHARQNCLYADFCGKHKTVSAALLATVRLRARNRCSMDAAGMRHTNALLFCMFDDGF